MVRKSIDRLVVHHEQNTIRNSVHRAPIVLEATEYAYFTRSAFYNPPKDNPLAFVSAPSSPDNLLSEAYEYGWAKAGDKFFNIYSLATSDRHPFDDESDHQLYELRATGFTYDLRDSIDYN
ncbi:uncharacterized protein BYT42DRAFT_609320 [Radiomyces spectabilis]|uniref:uncharacterized protein n=1 Tax=Radiomyces spectabilis TaxID=64574 RepID=UPI00221EACBA|nr:uncharacterized protein BYT42DRAFT_609320 [Radiomyces spectabilis]KAI8393532.1 hypothetical protein BYT42DRAFT_609320 [Radiomyces spectabilis]